MTHLTDHKPPQPVFFPVSLWKLALMSVCTVGLYQIHWFYWNNYCNCPSGRKPESWWEPGRRTVAPSNRWRGLTPRGQKSRTVLLARYPQGWKRYKCLCAGPSRLGPTAKEQVVSKHVLLGNSLLWASAIVASAALDAPSVLTLLVLPSLAAATWALSLTQSKGCASRAPGTA